MNLKADVATVARVYFTFIATLGISAIAFYGIQNLNLLPGGNIAFCKLLWLLYAIIFWFVTPSCLAFDTRLARQDRTFMKLFAANMWARGLIELYMMYVSINWHPHYGIAHDLFSAGLVVAMIIFNTPSRLLIRYAKVLISMLLLESYFAWYMLNNVTSSDPVYYVPQDEQHQFVFLITWIAVVLLTIYQAVFMKQWIKHEN